MSFLLRSTTRLAVKNKDALKSLTCLLSNSFNNKLVQLNESILTQRSIGTRALLANSILSKSNNLKKDITRKYSHVPYTRDMIEQRVLLVLRLYDKVDPNKLTLESNFSKDLGLDSLDQVDIVIAMEDEFGFEIPDEDGEHMLSPNHIVQYICDKFDVFE